MKVSKPINEVELLGGWALMAAVFFTMACMRTATWGYALSMIFWPLILLAVIFIARAINSIGGGHGR
jgi:hypothetical protein